MGELVGKGRPQPVFPATGAGKLLRDLHHRFPVREEEGQPLHLFVLLAFPAEIGVLVQVGRITLDHHGQVLSGYRKLSLTVPLNQKADDPFFAQAIEVFLGIVWPLRKSPGKIFGPPHRLCPLRLLRKALMAVVMPS